MSAFDPVTLKTENLKLEILPYGLTFHRLEAQGTRDLLAGPEDAKQHDDERQFRGPIIGRYANRLPTAVKLPSGLSLDLSSESDSSVVLHGGKNGFDTRVWEPLQPSETSLFSQDPPKNSTIYFGMNSRHGDQSLPGFLRLEAKISLEDAGEDSLGSLRYVLRAKLQEEPDVSETPVNLTIHWGFTLDSDGKDVLGHGLYLDANKMLELDSETSLPTGKLLDVENTSLDFRKAKNIGDNFPAQGIDDCFVFSRDRDLKKPVASLSRGDLTLSFTTNQNAVMLYTANGFTTDSGGPRKNLHRRDLTDQASYEKHGAIFLEFQAPVACLLHPELQQAAGTDTMLKKGAVYENWVELRISKP